MQLHTYKDAEASSQAAAKWIAQHIGETLKKQDRYTLALTGGSSPVRLHQILAGAPYKEQIDWSRLHIFWGDERAVPFDDPRNNAKMGFDTLLNSVPIPRDQIHVMRTDIPPKESAAEYEKILHRYFDGKPFSFDLIMLGMGDNAHTLSLFPGYPIVHEEKAWVDTFFLKEQDMYRITLTKTIPNRSALVAFLVFGAAKAPALKAVLEGPWDPDKYPSQVIKPIGGLHWFVDEAAAAQLTAEHLK